jgi:hypothetical protein
MKHRHHYIISILKAISFVIIFALCTKNSKAQIFQDLIPIEKGILETLLRDTISETYCQLPHGLTFGHGKKWGGNWVVLKSGRKNLLIHNGTPYVYSIIFNSKGIGIERVDEEIHRGDNFAKIAFFRKDTIIEVGGYGFWKVRDHFSYYNESKKRWYPRKSNHRLPFEMFHHYFDGRQDCFYLFGQIRSNNTNSNSERLFSDSMFRFSFRSGNWETLGKIEPAHWATLDDPWSNLNNTFHTPFGLGGTFSGSITLRDPEKNEWFTARDSVIVATSNYFDDIDSIYHNYRVLIHLNDSLHLFLGDSKTFTHGKIRLTRSDFESKPSGRIYIPVEKTATTFSAKSIWIGLLGGGSTFSILLILWIRKNRGNTPRKKGASNDKALTEVIDPMSLCDNIIIPEEKSDMDTFMASLSTGEKALVEKMYIATLQLKYMDIDSINKILGVGRKEASVQKTRRSTAINKINESFAICLKVKNPLIVRLRDEDDKRSYKYQIAEEHLDLVRKYLS